MHSVAQTASAREGQASIASAAARRVEHHDKLEGSNEM
jgi:hypothetical protein